MANAAYPQNSMVNPAIRADRPTVVEVTPDLRDALIVIVGSALVAIAAMALANYLMLPFGAG